jgi:Tfp pilus assembly protein PilF
MIFIRAMWFIMMLTMSGCSVIGPNAKFHKNSPAEEKLSVGVTSYEEGDYKSSRFALQGALDLGLNNKNDRLLAHKYLAFIHCISGHEKQCHDEFNKALEIDPTFELKISESGHPIWGPIFRLEKSKYTR